MALSIKATYSVWKMSNKMNKTLHTWAQNSWGGEGQTGEDDVGPGGGEQDGRGGARRRGKIIGWLFRNYLWNSSVVPIYFSFIACNTSFFARLNFFTFGCTWIAVHWVTSDSSFHSTIQYSIVQWLLLTIATFLRPIMAAQGGRRGSGGKY